MSVYRYSLLSCMAVALLLVGGCIGMPSKSYQKQWYYMIEVERDGAELATVPDSILVVRPFSISPMCEGKSFVIRRAQGEYESTYYHQFFVPPSRNLTEVAGRWVADSNLFEQVNAGSSLIPPKYALEGRIRKIVGDIVDEESPVAVVEMHFSLVDLSGEDPKMVFQKTYKKREPIAEVHPSTFPAGVNQACAAIFTELEGDLKAALR